MHNKPNILSGRPRAGLSNYTTPGHFLFKVGNAEGIWNRPSKVIWIRDCARLVNINILPGLFKNRNSWANRASSVPGIIAGLGNCDITFKC